MTDSPLEFADLKSPFVLVIFGATGNLAQTKLIPGLLSLFNQKHLPEDFFIIGFSRRDWVDETFVDSFTDLKGKEGWEKFSKHLHYQSGTFESKDGYSELNEKIKAFDSKLGSFVTRFFYLATPPKHYSEILDQLVATKLSIGNEESSKWARIIIEKPFGKDLETAKELDQKLENYFDEKQIFRVDHYLGKETVQNMLAFRFANGIFEPVWNKNYIDHVQITWAEKEGIENRGNFFDGIGMLRDVVQNHIMQLISAVAMEQPKSFTKDDVRNERAKVVSAVSLTSDSPIVRGQYEGYLDEAEVLENSQTDTFTALKLHVNTPRFEGVPFYLRAGKKMEKDVITVSVVFIQTCHILFKEYGCPEIGNVLTFRIQPDEGISLRVIAKKPGHKLSLGTVDMKFNYTDDFGTSGLDAYEKILLDIFAGDQILFSRSDEIENSWSLLDEILKKWQGEKNIPVYAGGGWGPNEANELIEKDGKKWL